MDERSDPFAFIDRECGSISSSQEDLFLLSPFINDTPRPMPPADAEEGLGLGPTENIPVEKNKGKSPFERTKSPPLEKNKGKSPLGLTEAPPVENSKGKSPVKEPSQGFSKIGKRKFGEARRTSKGAQLRLTDSDEEEGDGSKKPQPDAQRAPSGTRKLPATIQKPMEEMGKAPTAKVGSSGPNPPVPACLLDVVKAYSRKPNMRFANTDILEIAAMKGIHFPPPRWWRPGGYDAQKPKAPE